MAPMMAFIHSWLLWIFHVFSNVTFLLCNIYDIYIYVQYICCIYMTYIVYVAYICIYYICIIYNLHKRYIWVYIVYFSWYLLCTSLLIPYFLAYLYHFACVSFHLASRFSGACEISNLNFRSVCFSISVNVFK